MKNANNIQELIKMQTKVSKLKDELDTTYFHMNQGCHALAIAIAPCYFKSVQYTGQFQYCTNLDDLARYIAQSTYEIYDEDTMRFVHRIINPWTHKTQKEINIAFIRIDYINQIFELFNSDKKQEAIDFAYNRQKQENQNAVDLYSGHQKIKPLKDEILKLNETIQTLTNLDIEINNPAIVAVNKKIKAVEAKIKKIEDTLPEKELTSITMIQKGLWPNGEQRR